MYKERKRIKRWASDDGSTFSNSWWSHEVRRDASQRPYTTILVEHVGIFNNILRDPCEDASSCCPLKILKTNRFMSYIVNVSDVLLGGLRHAMALFLPKSCQQPANSSSASPVSPSSVHPSSSPLPPLSNSLASTALYIVYILWPLRVICVPIYIVSSFSAHLKTDGDRWRPLSLPEVLHFWNRVQLVGLRQHALSILQLHRPYGISFFW